MDKLADQPIHDRANRAFSNRGSLLVIAMVTVAAAAAIFAWNFRMTQSHRVLEFYGGSAASMIRRARQVEWLEVAGSDNVENDGKPIFHDPVDISDQPGLIHARAALISDVSYEWEKEPSLPDWQFALKFSDSNGPPCLIFFDLKTGQCMMADKADRVAIGPKLAEGLTAFRVEIQQRKDGE